MSVDPIQLLAMANPPPPGALPEAGVGTTPTEGLQIGRAAGLHQPGDLLNLSAMPGTPGYAAKMQAIRELDREQAIARGEDPDRPVISLDSGLILPESAMPNGTHTEPVPLPASTKRVAIYYGKGDTYNLAVESTPDWDTEKLLRALNEDQVKMLLDLAKALGVKYQDKTGDFS